MAETFRGLVRLLHCRIECLKGETLGSVSQTVPVKEGQSILVSVEAPCCDRVGPSFSKIHCACIRSHHAKVHANVLLGRASLVTVMPTPPSPLQPFPLTRK